jgi:hypothetical protein
MNITCSGTITHSTLIKIIIRIVLVYQQDSNPEMVFRSTSKAVSVCIHLARPIKHFNGFFSLILSFIQCFTLHTHRVVLVGLDELNIFIPTTCVYSKYFSNSTKNCPGQQKLFNLMMSSVNLILQRIQSTLILPES